MSRAAADGGAAMEAEGRDPGERGGGVRVIPVSRWRERALAAGEVAGLIPDRKVSRPSKLIPGRRGADLGTRRAGPEQGGLAAADGVSESSVCNVLRPAGAGDGDGSGAGAGPGR